MRPPPLTDALITERTHTIPPQPGRPDCDRGRSLLVSAGGQRDSIPHLVRGWSAGSRTASARVIGIRMGAPSPGACGRSIQIWPSRAPIDRAEEPARGSTHGLGRIVATWPSLPPTIHHPTTRSRTAQRPLGLHVLPRRAAGEGGDDDDRGLSVVGSRGVVAVAVGVGRLMGNSETDYGSQDAGHGFLEAS